MANLEKITRLMRQSSWGTFILLLILLMSFSPESLVKRYYEMKDYKKIIDIITSKNSSRLYGSEDYRICGEVAFIYGLYEESSSYYQKVLLVNKKGLTDQDLVNFAFALLKVGKGDQVLTNPCFHVDNKSYPWLNRLKNIAATRNKYVQKKDTMIMSSNLSMDFLPQYGLAFYNNRIYFSCPKFSDGKLQGTLSENNLIRDRRSELAGIKSALVGADGKAFSFEELKNKLKGSGRVATINLVDEGDNYFATVVSRDGSPEQIAVQGNLFPEFPYNSDGYASAMPFYSAEDQQLYFCSNKPGGYGGWDIYRCKLNDGKWEEPVNLGAKVNTPFDELFPSVFEDMLIFSAEAREGLGGFDNYAYSFTKDSVANLWAFNTTGDDLCLRIIQESPLKAIGVNVPNAKISTSEYDLSTILKQGDATEETSFIKSILEDNNEGLLADASSKGYGSNHKSEGFGNSQTKDSNMKDAETSVSRKSKGVPSPSSSQGNTVASTPQKSVVPDQNNEASPAQPPMATAPQKVVASSAPKKNVPSVQQLIAAVPAQKAPVAPSQQHKAASASPQTVTPDQEDDGTEQNATEPQDEKTDEKPEEAQEDSAPENGAPFLVPNPLANKHPEVQGLPTRGKKYGEVHLGDLFYDQNSVFFKSAHFPELDSIVEKIQNSNYNNIVIWSFTDRCGEEKYNASLSYQRAQGVVEYLKSRLQDANKKLYFTISARESFSVSSREVNALDRRVEVYAQSSELPFENIYAYKLGPGENIDRVSRIFNNRIDALVGMNTKTPELKSVSGYVYVGIQGIHMVSEGESLLRIALNNNCSVEQIIKANHKSGSDVLIGERLVLPLPFLDK